MLLAAKISTIIFAMCFVGVWQLMRVRDTGNQESQAAGMIGLPVAAIGLLAAMVSAVAWFLVLLDARYGG